MSHLISRRQKLSSPRLLIARNFNSAHNNTYHDILVSLPRSKDAWYTQNHTLQFWYMCKRGFIILFITKPKPREERERRNRPKGKNSNNIPTLMLAASNIAENYSWGRGKLRVVVCVWHCAVRENKDKWHQQAISCLQRCWDTVPNV